MQARLRNNSASDGGWEELSLPDEVRSVNSSLLSDDEEIVILGGNVSPRVDQSPLPKREDARASAAGSPTMTTMEIFRPSSALSTPQVKFKDEMSTISPSVVQQIQPSAPQAWTLSNTMKSLLAKPADLEKSLSPVEKTLLHQITKLSEELEVSKQKNEILEQTIHRDDLALVQDEDSDDGTLLRLGLKTLGFFVLLSIVQRKFLVSGFVSILGAAVVGGLLTYEQESGKRRRVD